MAQTLSRMLAHVIFGTKGRRAMIHDRLRPRLHAYLAETIRAEFGLPLGVGGPADHMHLLIDIRPVTAPAVMLRDIKSHSSRWIHETFPELRDFAWQAGYGIFSVSESQRDKVVAYIDGQEEHHRSETFQDEYVRFLERYCVEWDPRYIWE